MRLQTSISGGEHGRAPRGAATKLRIGRPRVKKEKRGAPEWPAAR